MKPSRLPSPAGEDGGAATVLAAFLVAALAAITLGGVWVGSAVIARHRAQAAADLAALAAAQRLAAGPQAACREAQVLASAMRAVLRGCEIEHLDVVLTVSIRVGSRIGEARAAARAGPSLSPGGQGRGRPPGPRRGARLVSAAGT